MHIYVGGSLEHVPGDTKVCRKFVTALGREIVKRDHILLNGCRSSLDRKITSSAQNWLLSNGRDPKKQIVGYCLKSSASIHRFGIIHTSALSDWQLNHAELAVPEQIKNADATVFIAGSEGTFWAKNWAYYARKPIFGIPSFGGAGETIYIQKLRQLHKKSPQIAEEFEMLNQLTTNAKSYAKDVVSLVEKFIKPRNVFVVMSFSKNSSRTFTSCEEVCKKFGFNAIRTDKSLSLERIIPRIETGIRESGFIIADISQLSPNVFYELGFAKGINKDVIMMAKAGTKLPFDISDIPNIFWRTQKDLRKQLELVLDSLRCKYL